MPRSQTLDERQENRITGPQGSYWRQPGLVLLAGLLLLRFPVLILGPMVGQGRAASMLFTVGTLLLTALLIFVERRRLEEFHLDGWGLLLFIVAPLINWDVNRIVFWRTPNPWLPPVVTLCLAAALLVTRTRWPRLRWQTLGWMGVAILAGLALSLILGRGVAWSGQLQYVGITPAPFREVLRRLGDQVFTAPLSQMANAALLEEPLFRGFLWGYLRQAGWQDRWIWLTQAALFMLGHIYYFNQLWFSLWVMVPVGALVLGLLAWRGRSIAPSMLAHGIMNGYTIIAAQIRW